MQNSLWFQKYQNIVINVEINFTYVDIGLFLSFLCNLVNLGAVCAVLSELFFGVVAVVLCRGTVLCYTRWL